MPRFKNLPFSKILVEIFSVVFAVLLALWVNEWRSVLEHRDLAGTALEHLLAEVRHNQAEINESLEGHRKMLDTLNFYIRGLENADESRINVLSDRFTYSYSHSVLNNTAWQTASITQAVRYMPYAQTEALSSIYELQSIYQEHGNGIFRNLGSVSFYDATFPTVIKSAHFNVALSLNIEEKLDSSYTVFLRNYAGDAGP
ncbi:MAG TPA: hypothetical protein PKV71_16005 [Calditrichia bacterium]|nr:hypothetical protein [Calditrichia bacterium]HQV33391.1 hypothetical protein [Calditrichia bacterium]